MQKLCGTCFHELKQLNINLKENCIKGDAPKGVTLKFSHFASSALTQIQNFNTSTLSFNAIIKYSSQHSNYCSFQIIISGYVNKQNNPKKAAYLISDLLPELLYNLTVDISRSESELGDWAI